MCPPPPPPRQCHNPILLEVFFFFLEICQVNWFNGVYTTINQFYLHLHATFNNIASTLLRNGVSPMGVRKGIHGLSEQLS